MGEEQEKMENEGNPSISYYNRPSFFTLILSDHSPITRRLRIPTDFVKYISEELTKSAILRVRSGRHWHIKIHQTEKGVYLQNGWKKFLNDNLLGDDEFLQFTYDGNMCFDVKIFDKSGSESERVFASVTTGTNEGPAINTGKRKRGRPRKIEKKSALVTVNRKQGRPRKIEKKSALITGNRKRGRPRKIEKCAPIIEKRKQGRPRKDFGGTPCIHQRQSCQNGPGIQKEINTEEIDVPILAPDNEPPPSPPVGSSERPVELN